MKLPRCNTKTVPFVSCMTPDLTRRVDKAYHAHRKTTFSLLGVQRSGTLSCRGRLPLSFSRVPCLAVLDDGMLVTERHVTSHIPPFPFSSSYRLIVGRSSQHPNIFPKAIEKKRRKDLRAPQKAMNRSRTVEERLPYPLTQPCNVMLRVAGPRIGILHSQQRIFHLFM